MLEKIYFNIANYLNIFKEIMKLRKLSNYSGTTNIKKLAKVIEELSKNPKILPEDRFKYFKEQVLDGLESSYGKDIANIKCKQFLFEIGLSVLTELKSSVAEFSIQYAIAFNKKKEINLLVEKVGVQLSEINKAKEIYNKNLDNKVKLMESSRIQLAQLNNGEFFLNNSVVTLLTTLARTSDSLFQDSDLEIGANTLHNFGINHTCQKLKYYIDKTDVNLFNSEEPLMQYNIEEAKKALEELKHFTNGSEESIKSYIKQANVTDLNSVPDEPNSVADAWVQCTNKLVAALDRCYKNTDVITNRIKDLALVKLTPIEDMIGNLEQIFKDTELPENDNENNEKLTNDYLELISIGVVSYNFYLQFNAYDVQTYLIDLNFLSFYTNILNELCVHYLKTMSDIFLDEIYRIKAEREKMKEEAKQQEIQQQQEQANQQQDAIQNANVNNPVDNNNQPVQGQQDAAGTTQTQASDGTQVNVPANQPQ